MTLPMARAMDESALAALLPAGTQHIQPVAPNLEDVFVAATREDRHEEATA